LEQFYDFKWFNLGDRDLATHIYRTDLFKKGFNKAEITMRIAEKMGIKSHLIPMTNESVQTIITTDSEEMHFEEFFIRYKSRPRILDIKFQGIDKAKPVKDVLDYIEHAERVIICPSNPVVSIGTILTIPGIRKTLKGIKQKVIAISPIIEGTTVKGPADKMMKYLGLEVSCVGVAQYYRDLISHFIIDNKDCALRSIVKEMNINAYCFDTLMVSKEKKKELANFVVNLEI
jgi:LPPG:FO 2-phospho-L-lactate transferase